MSSSRARSARPHAAAALLLAAGRRLACPTPHGRPRRRLPTLPRPPPFRRTRAAPARLHPSPQLGSVALGHDLLQPRQHLALFLAHVVLHALLEGVDAGVDLAVLVTDRAQRGHHILHACVLAERFLDETAQLGIRAGPRRRIYDLLLEPGMHVELTTDAVDRRAT